MDQRREYSHTLPPLGPRALTFHATASFAGKRMMDYRRLNLSHRLWERMNQPAVGNMLLVV